MREGGRGREGGSEGGREGHRHKAITRDRMQAANTDNICFGYS